MSEENKNLMGQNIQDINAKTIFKNAQLCAQFLRDYIDLPGFKTITEQDIEDVTERFISYFGIEYNADTVKKVHIHPDGEEQEIYVISLIDHKSAVDYNVSMQLLKYMVCIWSEYEKRLKDDTERDGIVENKSFKYPPILPIVYYEGKSPWTADRHLRDRVLLSDMFSPFIPDYEYIVISDQSYSGDELLERKDEMSLIMFLNKIQDEKELSEFLNIPAVRIDEILHESPKEVIDIIATVVRTLCERINLSTEEKEKCVRKVVNRQMGYLFENMDKIDVQAMRKEVAESRKALEESRKILAEQAKKTAEIEKRFAEQEKKNAEQEKKNAEQEKYFSDLRAVLRLFVHGKSHADIAQELNLTEDQVAEMLIDIEE